MEPKDLVNIETISDVTVASFNASSICGVERFELISNRLRGYVQENKPARLVVDFNGVKFFSSQMLGLLVDLWRKTGQVNGKMLISGINPQLGRVFKITNLDKIFQFYPDRDQAVKAICGI
ncbi:MAG: STAS domain-containing protein [Anaerohalosphaera sp.]|nr:STAS domain-containing protein [Anaerohalosphaera sp.]